MKINLEDLNDKIENQDYIQDLETVKYGDISKSKSKIKPYAEKMVKEVAAAFKHDSLVQTQLAVTGQRPVTFALETNIINLPYSNYKKIANFLRKDKNIRLMFILKRGLIMSMFRTLELINWQLKKKLKKILIRL